MTGRFWTRSSKLLAAVVLLSSSAAHAAGDQFVYVAIPTVVSLNPAAGPVAGGTLVTITGTNFIPGATVAFGLVASPTVTVVSNTQITAISPPGTGTVTVTVTTAGGTSPP